LLNIADCCNTT